MPALRRLALASVTHLTRVACLLALAGLTVITYPVFSPRALPIVLSMSLGQGLGVAAFFTYLLAVVIDLTRRELGDGAPATPKESESGHRS